MRIAFHQKEIVYIWPYIIYMMFFSFFSFSYSNYVIHVELLKALSIGMFLK